MKYAFRCPFCHQAVVEEDPYCYNGPYDFICTPCAECRDWTGFQQPERSSL